MGIKHVWGILTPFCERKPLYELQGKTVAVDLSCWICEAQNIAEYEVQPRMYLRNLYFRTCYLLLMDVTPVFVLEGKAPELKYDTISARNAVQFKGCKPKTDKVKTGKDRTRFHYILRSCEEMLRYMGIACIKGQGEAESMCAYLNEEGLVDGCISQDSDCFAYGAKVVYRNFSISTQGAYAASGGAVDIYDIRKAYESISFGRNKIVAMALLCGSDYCEGVQGIGRESVLKLFEKVPDEEIFDRIKSWKAKPDLYKEYESQISNKENCTSCGHYGKIQAHTKNGCSFCKTKKGCDPFKFKEERLRIKNEVNMRNKALQDPDFPNEDLINEYLVKKDDLSELNLKWKQPDMVLFVKYTKKFLQWDEIYSFEKILPILTRWQCLNFTLIQSNEKLKGIIQPERIKKTRNPKGVPSYEIIWCDLNGYFNGLYSENQIKDTNINLEKLWSTIEPQVLVEKAYPELVQTFKQSKIKPPKMSKRKKKQTNSEDKENTSICEPTAKKTRTRKTKTIKSKKITEDPLEDLENSFNSLNVSRIKKKTGTLDNFLKKAVFNSQKQKHLKDSTGKMDINPNLWQTSTPSKDVRDKINWSSFYDDSDDADADLSNIVEGIISRQPNFTKNNFDTYKVELDDVIIPAIDENNSSFFVDSPIENDLFEKTFHEIICAESDESTEEYDLDEIVNVPFDDTSSMETNCEQKSENYVMNIVKSSLDQNREDLGESEIKHDQSVAKVEYDSFLVNDIDVPLIERLKKKMK